MPKKINDISVKESQRDFHLVHVSVSLQKNLTVCPTKIPVLDILLQWYFVQKII